MLFGHFSHAHTLAFKTHLTKALRGIDAFKIFSSLERVAASLWDWRQFSFVRKTEPKKKNPLQSTNRNGAHAHTLDKN